MQESQKGFVRYPKIKTLGDRSNEGILTAPGNVCIQEKVDGANAGFYVKDGVIFFCSHNQNLTSSVQIGETGIPKHWLAVEPVLHAFYDNPQAFPENLYTYGESLQKHRIKYDGIPGFIGYDVFHLDAGMFMHWSWAKTIIEGMGLPFVNVIGEFNVPNDISHTTEGIEHLKTLYEHSAYRSEGAEGIVIKRYDTQQFAKIVDDAFKEKVKRPRTVHNSDTEQAIAEVYATPARIEKKIYDLRDDGVELDMGMMRSLFNLVVDDIIEECGEEIDEDYGKFVTKTLGSLVARKCAPVLKGVIMRGGR